MQQALERSFAPLAQWSRPRGGLLLWVELPRAIDVLPLLHQAVENERVAFIPGQPFLVHDSGSNTLWLSFSNVSGENIEIGLERISRLAACGEREMPALR
jgi:2-aminoadipate transaminase